MDIIEAENLCKSFDSFRAVDNVSIAVKEWEIFGFLGPNGAGKTMTIRMLTGILTPDSGLARICGIDIRKPARSHGKDGDYPGKRHGLFRPDCRAEPGK